MTFNAYFPWNIVHGNLTFPTALAPSIQTFDGTLFFSDLDKLITRLNVHISATHMRLEALEIGPMWTCGLWNSEDLKRQDLDSAKFDESFNGFTLSLQLASGPLRIVINPQQESYCFLINGLEGMVNLLKDTISQHPEFALIPNFRALHIS